MHKALNVMWDVTHKVCDNDEHVWLEMRGRHWDLAVDQLCQFNLESPSGNQPYPEGVTNLTEFLVFCLVTNSINYCYWYGWDEIRPNGSGYKVVADVVAKAIKACPGYNGVEDLFPAVVSKVKWGIRFKRLPMLEERLRHLEELIGPRTNLRQVHNEMQTGDPLEMTVALSMLEAYFPGYVSDIFLKRASLFLLELYRSRNLFGRPDLFMGEIGHLPVPIDYHIPNVLQAMELLCYVPTLKSKIQAHELIPKGSRWEVEIRAQSALVCRKLAAKVRCSAAEVDTWLYLQRKKVNTPFHLTITTDY